MITVYATASAAGQGAARVTLEALGSAVLVGLWGTLELIFIGFWFLGVGWLLRTDWRRFSVLSMVVGVGALMAIARTGLTGRTLAHIDGPIDLVVAAPLGLIFVWELWLAAPPLTRCLTYRSAGDVERRGRRGGRPVGPGGETVSA